MKRLSAIFLILVLVVCVAGCGGSDAVTSSENSTSSKPQSNTASSVVSSEEPTVDPATCTHEYSEQITRKPKVLKEGEKTFICKYCRTSYTEPIEKTETGC